MDVSVFYLQIQIIAFNSELYNNLSHAQVSSNGIVIISLLAQVRIIEFILYSSTFLFIHFDTDVTHVTVQCAFCWKLYRDFRQIYVFYLTLMYSNAVMHCCAFISFDCTCIFLFLLHFGAYDRC